MKVLYLEDVWEVGKYDVAIVGVFYDFGIIYWLGICFGF